MAIVANTFRSTDAAGNREELSDVIDMITPHDTPIYTMSSKISFKTTHPEWEYDELDAPAANIVTEGDEYDFSALSPVTRVGNHTQIMRKTGIISRSQNQNDNAGKAEQLARKKVNRGKELRKDIELALVTPNASVGGNTREFGSLPTWIETNASRGAGGANGGFNGTTGLTEAPTDGTQRAFTLDLLDDVMQQGYEAGSDFKHVFVSPYVKSVFTTFINGTGSAQFRSNVSDGTDNAIIKDATIYYGPFGKVDIIPNRVMGANATAARNGFVVDPDYLEFGWYRRIADDNRVAPTGDHDKFVMLGEGAPKIKNEAGLGIVADLFGLTATT